MTFIKKDLDLIRNNVLTNITYNVTEINDTNVGSALDMFVTSIGYEIKQQYDEMQVIYDGFHIDTATDYDLDQLGSLIGVGRSGGVEASGTISLIRNTPATSVFTIPSGIVVTTQPDTNSTVLSYTTTEEAVFPISGVGSEIFIDGIYNYKLNNKVFKDLSIEVSSTPFTNFIVDSEFSGQIIDTSTIQSIATCESTASWTALAGAANLTVNSTYKIQGSNSLNLIKTSTVTDEFSYIYSLSNTDLDGKSLCVSLRTTSTFLTNKFSKVELTLGSGYDAGSGNDNNNYTWSINDISSFTDSEFTRFFLDIANATISNAPNITEIDFIKIKLFTQNTTDTVSANEFIMDFWFGCEYEDFSGYCVAIDKTTKPTSGNTMDFEYTPLSVDVKAESSNVGEKYNAGTGQITYLSSIVSGIDRVYNYSGFISGEDEESDTDYRERITSGAYVQATSSSSAIEENLKSIEYIKDAIVIDMPEGVVESEDHIYNSTTKLIPLNKYIAKDTITLLVSDTSGGSADYVKDTDYSLTDDNELNFDLGGTEPTNGNTVYVDYDYDALGKFTVIVVGNSGYLTTNQIAEVTSLVQEIKSPGTIATVSLATYTQINITSDIVVDEDYDSDTIKENVIEAIESYVTSLGIGDDVLISKIMKAIISVEGVIDSDSIEINSVAANHSISQTEKATPNTTTITVV